ncbi:helix-turn-helix domain-containing protein [Bacillus pumilus]|uniref:helix-turn-helix domain-containing protein n=1 Tax=Bacillus pumilus TaxID=1408 RepID=UPI003D75677C
MQEREVISVTKVSEMLHVTTRTVRNMINAKELQAYKTGKGWNVYKDSVEEYILKNTNN